MLITCLPSLLAEKRQAALEVDIASFLTSPISLPQLVEMYVEVGFDRDELAVMAPKFRRALEAQVDKFAAEAAGRQFVLSEQQVSEAPYRNFGERAVSANACQKVTVQNG